MISTCLRVEEGGGGRHPMAFGDLEPICLDPYPDIQILSRIIFETLAKKTHVNLFDNRY